VLGLPVIELVQDPQKQRGLVLKGSKSQYNYPPRKRVPATIVGKSPWIRDLASLIGHYSLGLGHPPRCRAILFIQRRQIRIKATAASAYCFCTSLSLKSNRNDCAERTFADSAISCTIFGSLRNGQFFLQRYALLASRTESGRRFKSVSCMHQLDDLVQGLLHEYFDMHILSTPYADCTAGCESNCQWEHGGICVILVPIPESNNSPNYIKVWRNPPSSMNEHARR